MPFKSKKQKNLFGACMNDEFRRKRARAGKPCPSKSTIREMFRKDKGKGKGKGKGGGRKKGRKKR